MGPIAGRTLSLATHEIDFLKETLHAQQELLQKLYNELDMERESSSTAADEALSMILRLQGEKAAVGMEASQYRRIAEEKMCHAQETLEIFQELIYHKEMQIASLEFQVQAYRFKLVSMGCDDLGSSEMQYPENMLSRKNGVLEESLRRGSSLPPHPVNVVLSRRGSTEGTKSSMSSPQTWQEHNGAEPSIRREQGDFNSYWEDIRKLDERVKELNNIKGCSSFPLTEDKDNVSLTSTSQMQNPSPENSPTKFKFSESPEKVNGVQASGDSACSTSIQDIFEVPICSYNKQDGSNEKRNLTLESENRMGKPDAVWDEIWKTDDTENIEWEKKPLLSPDSDKSSPKTNDAKEIIDWEKKPLLSPGGSNETPLAKDGKSDKLLLFKHPTYGVADFELQQLNRRLKQLEDQRFVTRGHEMNNEKAEEQLRVLLEIRGKIDSMQADITCWRNKMPLPPEDRSPGCLQEVFLCFWP